MRKPLILIASVLLIVSGKLLANEEGQTCTTPDAVLNNCTRATALECCSYELQVTCTENGKKSYYNFESAGKQYSQELDICSLAGALSNIPICTGINASFSICGVNYTVTGSLLKSWQQGGSSYGPLSCPGKLSGIGWAVSCDPTPEE